MTQPYLPKRDDLVRCLDASQGMHFLVAGRVYTVADVFPGLESGQPRLTLRGGPVRAWEPARFELVRRLGE